MGLKYKLTSSSFPLARSSAWIAAVISRVLGFAHVDPDCECAPCLPLDPGVSLAFRSIVQPLGCIGAILATLTFCLD